MSDRPRFDDLPFLDGLDIRHAWDVWGREDTLGTVNLLTAARVAAAAQLVRTGEVVSLDLPLDLPDPPLFGRQPYRHEIFRLNRNEMDDRLDNFHPQASTQWDALSHVRAREHGFYGGRTQDPVDGPIGLGIDHYAEHGMAGRGVLCDIAGYFEVEGRAYDPFEPQMLTVEDVQGALEAAGVVISEGDILCLRTGWVGAYRQLDAAGRRAYADDVRFAGLRGDEDMARFLWDSGIAALCADNPAVEAVPGDPAVGSLHRRVLPSLGLALGEMFEFEALARAASGDGRYAFLFVAAPLKIPGGLGSPGNAVAIR
ncbi:MAG: cyclase family protein [Acidimicrobiia bacterium]|nr:cyclase family protein [Acidimicrobiia bacterium]